MELCLAEFVPKTISDFIAQVSATNNNSHKLSNILDYLSKLEDERRKIDAFKRELPLSVLLVNDAIRRLKDEERLVRDSSIDEFVPLKKKKKRRGRSSDEEDEDEIARVDSEMDVSDKRDWMSSVQLWSSNADFDLKPRRERDSEEEEEDRCVSGKWQVGNYRNEGRAFVALKAHGSSSSSSSGSQIIPSLSLMTPISSDLGGSCSTTIKSNSNSISNPKNNPGSGFRGISGSTSAFLTPQVKTVTKPQQQQQQQQQQQNMSVRKQRRCWSPELHRRFIDALQQLGGSQAATPKQIRDLMDVDGLTNDEVKSHLQKYRLHVRKLPNSSGGLWMNQQDHHSEDDSKSNINTSQSGSPQGPLLANVSSNNKALSNNGGDTEAEEDDERSDGHSWRGQNGNIHNEAKST